MFAENRDTISRTATHPVEKAMSAGVRRITSQCAPFSDRCTSEVIGNKLLTNILDNQARVSLLVLWWLPCFSSVGLYSLVYGFVVSMLCCGEYGVVESDGVSMMESTASWSLSSLFTSCTFISSEPNTSCFEVCVRNKFVSRRVSIAQFV
jgi:hypothetical protein